MNSHRSLPSSLAWACLALNLAARASDPGAVVLAPVLRHDGTRVELRVATPPGPRYRIEACSDLGQWQPVAIATPGAAGTLSFADPVAARRFYRAAVPRAAILAAFTPPNLPEGLAMDAAGNAFLAMAPTGEIWKVAPDGSSSRIAQVPTLAAGIAVGPGGVLYVAVAPQPPDPARHGVWRVDTHGTAAPFAILPPDSLPNDVVPDATGLLLVTDSIGGRVFRIDTSGTPTLWIQSPLLLGAPDPVAPHPPFPIGANGLAVVGTNAFVANTDLGTLVRIPIHPGGTAGTPEVLVGGPLLGGADGLRADAQGRLHVANVIQNLVLRVAPTGAIETLADGRDGLDSPSSLCLGALPGQRARWYAVNYATISASIPGGAPKPGLLRIDTEPLDTLAVLTPPNLPEGLAIDDTGNVFLAMAPLGDIWKLAPDGVVSRFAQVPTLAAGITVGPSGVLYVAVAPQPPDPARHGVWRVDTHGTAAPFAILPPDSLPNDVVPDAAGLLFVTDSIGGRVFRVDTSGTPTLWIQSPLLLGAPDPVAPHPPFPIGANGLAVVGTNAFVANTDLGTLVRIPILPGGTAGTPEVFVGGPLLGGADGLRADAQGRLHVANVIQNLVLRVAPTGAIEILADGLDGLDSPSSLAFEPGPSATRRLLVVNYATISAAIPGGNPRPALLRFRSANPGSPTAW